MASILETETSNLGYNGIKTEISRHSRNVNKGLQTNSDDSKKEIKNNTLSSLANIKIKQIRLPKILTQSTDVNYNKKIIRLKKNFLKKEEEESKDKFLITGLENKGIDTPVASALITLASSLLRTDYRAVGYSISEIEKYI